MQRLGTAVVLVAASISVLGQGKPPAGKESPARSALIQQLTTTADGMLAKRAATVATIHTEDDAKNRQAQVRAKILQLIGGLPGEKERGLLSPQIVGQWQGDGFRVERVIYQSLPRFYVTANLYLPQGDGPFPAILETPGHSPEGKAGEYAFASNFARNGIAVLAIDPLGQGERLQYLDPATGKSRMERPTGEHAEASLQPMLIGDHISRYFINDGMRGVDYLLTRPEIDPRRIAAFGCSGGGTDTAYLTALDPRIKIAGVACYMGRFEELLPSATGVQEAEQTIPRFIAEGLNIPDWAELAAPRPYAVISTTEDMFPFAGAKAAVEEIRGFYSHFGAEKNVQWITGPGPHGNLRPIFGQILDFFRTGLAVQTARVEPVFGQKPPADALQCTKTGQVGSSFADAETVSSLNRARMPRKLAIMSRSLPPLPKRIRTATGATILPGAATLKADRAMAKTNNAMLPGVLHADVDVPLAMITPASTKKLPLTILLARDVTSDATHEVMHKAAAASGGNVLAVGMRPSPAGGEEQKAKALGDFYLLNLRALLVGKTLVGMRIDDLIAATNWACTQRTFDCGNITAIAEDGLGPVLLQAAVLDSRLKHLQPGDAPTWSSIVKQPITTNAPENLVPGVVLSYDIPELKQALRLKP
ncbi:alpha/beta hydrolase family protein [Terriglobus tenax]|uniref:alpha/beta hydrolase family protein n=1 Tax=Terriglobus tenax TaxID=1111115 RepID=UPI0021E0F1F1|nr:acetylxylan esterase [Terriglobus tenax]